MIYISFSPVDPQHVERVVHLATILTNAGYLVWIDEWKPADAPWDRFLNTMLATNVIKLIVPDR